MAGGPIFPYSAVPDSSGETFPSVHRANSRYEEGLGLAASIAVDRIWHLRFALPTKLPSGTGKLVIVSMANATTGTVVIEPQWASIDPNGENAFTATLNLEGDTTITWLAGDGDKYKETKITLDADTMVAGEIVVMSLKFDAISTLAVTSTHQALIIWE